MLKIAVAGVGTVADAGAGAGAGVFRDVAWGREERVKDLTWSVGW